MQHQQVSGATSYCITDDDGNGDHHAVGAKMENICGGGGVTCDDNGDDDGGCSNGGVDSELMREYKRRESNVGRGDGDAGSVINEDIIGESREVGNGDGEVCDVYQHHYDSIEQANGSVEGSLRNVTNDSSSYPLLMPQTEVWRGTSIAQLRRRAYEHAASMALYR